MFSFHKPKVYRSTQGCCICKAKSSSSRFTDSKKYEDDFMECFQLSSPRRGEICNACVLLVKRFKRLPPGSERHWSHVVDARIGPGIKSMTKFKKRKEEQQLQQQNDNTIAREFAGQSKSNAQNIKASAMNNAVTDCLVKMLKKAKKKKLATKREPGSSDENSEPSSSASTSSDVDDMDGKNRLLDGNEIRTNGFNRFNQLPNDHLVNTRKRIDRRFQRKAHRPLKNCTRIQNEFIHLVDNEFWVQIKTCCGYVYENQTIGALLIDANNLAQKSCPKHGNQTHETVEMKEEPIAAPAPKSLPPKKQKRALETSLIDLAPISQPEPLLKDARSINADIQTIAIDYSTATNANSGNQVSNKKSKSHVDTSVGSRAYNYLHKIKSDSGKITKNNVERLTPSKIKMTDLNVVKNLVKFCTDKTAVGRKFGAHTKNGSASTAEIRTNENASAISNENENNSNKIIEALAANKFSDNSSDSGYDETLHDTAQLNQIAKIGSTRPVILSNGVKLHVQPQNLLLAANLAGVSQTAIESTQANMKQLQLHQTNQYNGTSTSTTNNPSTSPPRLANSHANLLNDLNVSAHDSVMNTKNTFVAKPKLLTVASNN